MEVLEQELNVKYKKKSQKEIFFSNFVLFAKSETMENSYMKTLNCYSKFVIIFYILLLINKLIAAEYHSHYNHQRDTHNVAKRMDLESCLGNYRFIVIYINTLHLFAFIPIFIG